MGSKPEAPRKIMSGIGARIISHATTAAYSLVQRVRRRERRRRAPTVTLEIDPEDQTIRESEPELELSYPKTLSCLRMRKSTRLSKRPQDDLPRTAGGKIRPYITKVTRKPASPVGRRPVKLMEIVVVSNCGTTELERVSRAEL